MSKHINTHLFFHMNDHNSRNAKQKSSSNETTTSRKPQKKSSNLFSGYDTENSSLAQQSGDYYDYYTNYGIPDYGPISPPGSPQYMYGNMDSYGYSYDYSNNEYNDYYNPNSDGEHVNYREDYANYERGYMNDQHYTNHSAHGRKHHSRQGGSGGGGHSSNSMNVVGAPPGFIPSREPNAGYLQPPLISPPIPRTSSSPQVSGDPFAYRSDPQAQAISHKLHRITFVEACISMPPEVTSPSMPRPPPPPPHGPVPAVPPTTGTRPVMPVLAQGERSPTTTGGTQYYQEWTSKHMRHLCSRFSKPDQQQLLMNVERKSKFPFIILCTPETSSLSKSSSSASSTSKPVNTYGREISQHSVYSVDDDDDQEEEDEEANWITQKQRDSININYLPPPPPPMMMPHIWPEIRYIDGLYTVCAYIVRPGWEPEDPELAYLNQDMNALSLEQGNYGGMSQTHHHQPDHPYPHHQHQPHPHSYQPGGYPQSHSNQAPPPPPPPSSHHSMHHTTERHISFQETQTRRQTSNNGPERPAGYIVSAFATFPGEDSERLEKNWLYWTGARVLYKYLPMCVGLRRMIFLKRCPDMYREDMVQSKVKPTIFTGFTYVLLCECFNLHETYIATVCTTIDQLRARCCGYSALYLTHYQQQSGGGGGGVASSSTVDHHHHHHPHQATAHSSSSAKHHHVPRHHRSTDFSEFEHLEHQ